MTSRVQRTGEEKGGSAPEEGVHRDAITRGAACNPSSLRASILTKLARRLYTPSFI